MSEEYVSGRLPVLALRGLAVFPEQTVHFDVGRKKSVLALEAAMKQDQLLLLITCVDDQDERRVVAARRIREDETEDGLQRSVNRTRKW